MFVLTLEFLKVVVLKIIFSLKKKVKVYFPMDFVDEKRFKFQILFYNCCIVHKYIGTAPKFFPYLKVAFFLLLQ